MKITYIGGAGRLGLPLAAWSAWKGHHVIVADINAEEVDRINAREIDRLEPSVGALVSECVPASHLCATTDIAAAAAQSELICIIVPTPSLPSGGFSNEYVLDACREIGKGLHASAFNYPVVEISSTVMPGSTMGPIRAVLENNSNRVVGKDFGLVYSPEFIRQGSIIQDFSHPDVVLIGSCDYRATAVAWEYYASVVDNDPPFHVMSPVSAEIAKLSLNATVVAKMAMANTIAALCHVTPGADAASVLDVIGADSRIGLKFFGAGTWPGGPCFPRDTRALVKALVDAGAPASAAIGVEMQSGEMAAWLVRYVAAMAGSKNVGVLGLTYKPGVDIIEESQGLHLAERLGERGMAVRTHDPSVLDPVRERQVDSLSDLVAWADMLVLMTCWPEYRALLEMDLGGKITLDMWGFLEELGERPILYYRFGEGL